MMAETEHPRRRFYQKPRFWVIFGLVLACLICQGVYVYLEETQLDTDNIDQDMYVQRYMAQYGGSEHGFPNEGYGFPYENGWSSVDLQPYYVENPDNLLVKLEETDFFIRDVNDMPVLDGAEAAYPVYSAFACNCYNIIDRIQIAAKEEPRKNRPQPIQFTNTVEAYKKLLTGEVDIFFGAMPSAAQRTLAEEAGVELVMTPIAKEAFVFFVSEENPVDGLTSTQIREIYSGEITSWHRVGGVPLPILAFQRPNNSGSQTMMQHFMGDVPLEEPLEVEFSFPMIDVVHAVADYQNKAASIGYSFRYYTTQMTGAEHIKFLELDGVYPSAENILNDSYPMTTALYAITIKGNPNEMVAPFVEWMTGEQGQEIIEKTGYIPLKS